MAQVWKAKNCTMSQVAQNEQVTASLSQLLLDSRRDSLGMERLLRKCRIRSELVRECLAECLGVYLLIVSLKNYYFFIIHANNLKEFDVAHAGTATAMCVPSLKKQKALCSNIILAVTRPAEVTKMQLLKFNVKILPAYHQRTAHLLVLFWEEVANPLNGLPWRTLAEQTVRQNEDAGGVRGKTGREKVQQSVAHPWRRLLISAGEAIHVYDRDHKADFARIGAHVCVVPMRQIWTADNSF